MGIPQHWVEAIEFNDTLEIPVEWVPKQKATWRSGRGMYDYTNRASHYHVMVLEDLTAGRIKRKYGDFLCGAKITDPDVHKVINLSGRVQHEKRNKVTCPKCLERIAKIKK
jgi:hypothetical protein